MFEAVFNIQEREPIEVEFTQKKKEPIGISFEISPVPKYHNQLAARDAEDCHPIDAITGLREELDEIEHNQKPIIGEGLVEVTESDEDITITTKTFVHEQGVASAVWTVQHNLNKYPSVTVVDSAENEIIAEIEYMDKNSVKITMTGASKGRAYLN